jgi:Tfp pilus assembly protein PilV
MVRTAAGLTIIEVLFASVVFMIGTGIIACLIGTVTTRYSLNDHIEALDLARASMEQTLAADDYSDTVYAAQGAESNYRIERLIMIRENLICIRINVAKFAENRLLVTLYDEKYIR